MSAPERDFAAFQLDEDDDDYCDEWDCTRCAGEQVLWGSEIEGYDFGWLDPNTLYPCPACGGSGARKDQVVF